MDKSPFFVEQKALTPADEVRDLLAQLEAKIARLGRSQELEARTILDLFDAIHARLADLHAGGQALRAEEARWEAVSAAFRRKAGTFLRVLGGAGALAGARRARQPEPAAWWWAIDQWLAEKRRAQLRRLLRWAAVAAVALALLTVLYNRFLAPDPATRERLRHEQAADSLTMDGNLAGALGEVEQALGYAPGDASLLALKGVLQQELGQAAAAQETFAAAEKAAGSREAFLITRAQMYLRVADGKAMLADTQEVIAANPQSAPGYLLLGQANQTLGNDQAAIAAYEKSGSLADAQNNPQLAAIARMNLATLLQQIPVGTPEGNQ
jgi:cytochrome c-type biogenesis protein CcmH/NrfG